MLTNDMYVDMYIAKLVQFVLDSIPIFLLLLIIIQLITSVFYGCLCQRMARRKGYKGYFWTGFFLRLIGFVYVIFLPDLVMRKYTRMCAMKMQIVDDRIVELEEKD